MANGTFAPWRIIVYCYHRRRYLCRHPKDLTKLFNVGSISIWNLSWAAMVSFRRYLKSMVPSIKAISNRRFIPVYPKFATVFVNPVATGLAKQLHVLVENLLVLAARISPSLVPPPWFELERKEYYDPIFIHCTFFSWLSKPMNLNVEPSVLPKFGHKLSSKLFNSLTVTWPLDYHPLPDWLLLVLPWT